MVLTLDTLPETLKLEICSHIDIFGLVAFSEVNRSLRYLANSQRSFWLHSIARSGLFLPLPTHRPLHSFTAVELNIAAHRAVLSERNITSEAGPKLMSSRRILWPYEPCPGVEANNVAWEIPDEAIYMHLSHPNAEWLFTVSSNNILRILHLRSGKLSLVYHDDRFHSNDNRGVSTRIAWAVEFREENDASLVMNCHVWDGCRWNPAIRLWKITFKPKEYLATMELISTRIMPEVASHLDIAGGYIVAVGPAIRPYDSGKVHLLRWKDMKEIPLPTIYPSVRIAAFQEYFVTVGLSPENRVTAQIVGYPYDSSGSPKPPGVEDETYQHMAIHSYELDFQGSILDRYHIPFACQICHFYTGAPLSPITIWLRSGRQGDWSIYTLNLDLAGLRSSASRYNTGRASEGEPLSRYYPNTEEQYRILSEATLRHWCVPVASGRRFMWWRPKEARRGQVRDEERMNFRLFLSVTDDLAPLAEVETECLDGKFRLDWAGTYDEGSAAAKQLRAARKMEIPDELKSGLSSESRLYMFVMEEWSGTILVQLYNGDLWVLRYGKT